MRSEKAEFLRQSLAVYFAPFAVTHELVSELIASKRHPIEVLILLCSRLDALASDVAPEETPSKQAFVHFVQKYGGSGDFFSSVSIGDLYYELAYQLWRLSGTIQTPGRLHRFSSLDDPIIRFLDAAGLPLTLEASQTLFRTLMRALREKYRAFPGQPLKKGRLVKPADLQDYIRDRFRKTRLHRIVDNLPSALKSLIETKTVSSLLYKRFRCEAIHGATLLLNHTKFMSGTDVYWEPSYSEFYGNFELIEFPARFLALTLNTCIKNLQYHLIGKQKLPPSIYFWCFNDDRLDHLEFLDESLLPEGGAVRLKINR